jgi:hypothetical protein
VILKGESVEIKTVLPPKSTVVWSPPTGLSDVKSVSPIANPLVTTTYQVKITTKEGCHFIEELKIIVVDLKIPNGLTPNGDGINDKWEIEGVSAITVGVMLFLHQKAIMTNGKAMPSHLVYIIIRFISEKLTIN